MELGLRNNYRYRPYRLGYEYHPWYRPIRPSFVIYITYFYVIIMSSVNYILCRLSRRVISRRPKSNQSIVAVCSYPQSAHNVFFTTQICNFKSNSCHCSYMYTSLIVVSYYIVWSANIVYYLFVYFRHESLKFLLLIASW